MRTRPDLAAYALAALSVVGIVVLSVLHVAVPDFLTFAGTTALGIGGGVALQGVTSSAADSVTSVTPAPVAAAPAPAPLVGATTDPAATGVFRAATHA